ncbi:hypothetical protein VM1G_10182 [Cytospora mali]|uniref:non-specific serine/threonine protein kinase n=1 Tax=Cytospora mali TaxID=578113 RepID=A0A194WDI3_CYTMA|nr:hypothetical protein VM1G_10182 [Valsa mali]
MDTSRIQESHPIGNCLESLHQAISSLEQKHGSIDAVYPAGIVKPIVDLLTVLTSSDLRIVTLQLATALLGHPASSVLPSVSGTAKLGDDILQFIRSDFDFVRVKPLLATVLERKSDQELWDQVYKVVTESTPPPHPPSLASQTPRTKGTGYIHNSLQYRTDTDSLLKEELGDLYADVPDFHDAFFGRIPGLQTVTDNIFKECQQGASPSYRDGKWVGWPEDAKQDKVLRWLASFCDILADMAKSSGLVVARRLLPLADKPIEGSTLATRKLDVGFVDKAQAITKLSFSHIHVPGELKSNPKADTAAQAWFDIARYAREVFISQDNRRFVLSFTLCGSHMRVWEFDRAGGIGSTLFNIHENGPRLILTLLGFLTMGESDLGYDPTIKTTDSGEPFIEIIRNGKQESLILCRPRISKVACLVGRATNCWKAYSKEHPDITLVVKDSWQHLERQEEGDLLQQASIRGVTNIAKYYYHETVQVNGQDDDILNIRNRLDLSRSLKTWPLRSHKVSRGSNTVPKQSGAVPLADNPYSNTISRKRSSNPNNTLLPPSKRTCSVSLANATTSTNRVHRRVILSDYGVPIYKASSRVVLLTALEGCIRGHKSLLDAHLLHRDISMNNLIINEKDPSRSFLIDLDLAIDLQRTSPSGSKGITGTLAFMAIGALWGKPHTFRYDLESFFWVLFWLCIHFPRPPTGEDIVIEQFEAWNYMQPENLAILKKGYTEAETFNYIIERHFTPTYQPLCPWVDELRKRLFVNPVEEDRDLYDDMLDILRKAREDPKVAAP